MSPVKGRAKQHPRGGMAGGIRGYNGGRVGGAATITPRTSTPTPDRNTNLRPGLPFRINIDEYFPKAADVQAEPGLDRGIWISDREYVPLPPGDVNYATDAEGIHKMFAAKHGLPTPPGTPAKLIAIDDNGITKRLSTIRPGATATGSQAGCSASSQLHRTNVGTQERLETSTERHWPGVKRENGDQCPPEEDEETQINEEDE